MGMRESRRAVVLAERARKQHKLFKPLGDKCLYRLSSSWHDLKGVPSHCHKMRQKWGCHKHEAEEGLVGVLIGTRC